MSLGRGFVGQPFFVSRSSNLRESDEIMIYVNVLRAVVFGHPFDTY